jgi:hypothetical protein
MRPVIMIFLGSMVEIIDQVTLDKLMSVVAIFAFTSDTQSIYLPLSNKVAMISRYYIQTFNLASLSVDTD